MKKPRWITSNEKPPFGGSLEDDGVLMGIDTPDDSTTRETVNHKKAPDEGG